LNDNLYGSLAWLPQAPRDFRHRCRAVLDAGEPTGGAIAHLAGFALDENQLRRLAAAIDRLRQSGRSVAPLVPFKLGVVGNVTLEPVLPALIASASRHGVLLECVQADFAQTIQEALAPGSPINVAKPDAVLLALDYRGLPLAAGLHDTESAADMVSGALRYLHSLANGFRTNAGALSIVQTLAPPPETTFGSFDRRAPGTLRGLTAAFNAALVDSLRADEHVLFDVAALAETVGLASWHSPTQWNMAKLAFDAKFLPLYADHVGRIIGALRGKSRRCLILDLDNTVWGGVIGDDGLEGLVIGQGEPTGEAYLSVQRAALDLRNRGVVLAVSSKNDETIARSAFVHPDMLLRENHFAVFQANWKDKATNIAAIAEELSLGLDAIVFLDDNPVERGLIRELLPQVAVPELPEDPALYARTLAAAGYFEAIAFSDEDRNRAAFYEENARRVALREQIGDVDAYLASLNMEIVFAPFDAVARSRITQLINKSNQFNLTTRRYSELEVAAFEADPGSFTLQVRLIDAFGDNGMIGVVICHAGANGDWEIDTWLMSCRVLGRRVEHMVLREILHHARARGVQRLMGVYLPTERNRLVEHHYATLGFRLVEQKDSGATLWELDTAEEVAAAPMTVNRSAFELSTA
jgi:FkbH-like protein